MVCGGHHLPLFGSAQLYVGKEASDMIAWLNGKRKNLYRRGSLIEAGDR